MLAKSADRPPSLCAAPQVDTCILFSVACDTMTTWPPFRRSGPEAQAGQPLTQKRPVVSARRHTWASLPPKPRPLPMADLALCVARAFPGETGSPPREPFSPSAGVLTCAGQLTTAPSWERYTRRAFQTTGPKSVKSVAPRTVRVQSRHLTVLCKCRWGLSPPTPGACWHRHCGELAASLSLHHPGQGFQLGPEQAQKGQSRASGTQTGGGGGCSAARLEIRLSPKRQDSFSQGS